MAPFAIWSFTSGFPKSSAAMGTSVSGRAVPTAASRLPTTPWERFNLSPISSTALVKSSAAKSIPTKEAKNKGSSIIWKILNLVPLGGILF